MPVRPQDQNPDRPAGTRHPPRKSQEERHYGKNATFDPESEETETEEYKKGGLPQTTKYSVDKH